MNEVTTLFPPGMEPPGLRVSSIQLSSDGTWLISWPGDGVSSSALINLSGPMQVLHDATDVDEVNFFGFVEGVGD